jgi:DNA adenine methylase
LTAALDSSFDTRVHHAPVAPATDDGVRPFLKWAGGKRQLLPHLLPRIPPHRRYFEPFVGGGAVFFAHRPRRAVLADVNQRLIRTYQGIRDDVGEVVRLLKTYRHDRTFYYALRESDVDAGSNAEVAAWFIYLNKTGYNGLYRVNRKNRFNVPFGRYANPGICQEETLRACAEALDGTEIVLGDFETIAARARRGDFVYFDPPYVPLSASSSFTSYTSDGFGLDDQTRLRDVARALKRRGVGVLLSNSSAPLVRQLYRDDFDIFEVAAKRNVNSQGRGRGAITELVIR